MQKTLYLCTWKISKSIETTITHADEVACGISNEYKENHQILEYAFKHAGRMIGIIHYEGVKEIIYSTFASSQLAQFEWKEKS